MAREQSRAGKHSLYQAIHATRRALGSEDVVLGSTALQLNPDLITSDVAEFEDAIAQGAHERAVRLYRGPFLEGFRLDQATEFEQWQDAERLRHSREYVTALEALALAARKRGQHADRAGRVAGQSGQAPSSRRKVERRSTPRRRSRPP